jgi:hypothetical protein
MSANSKLQRGARLDEVKGYFQTQNLHYAIRKANPVIDDKDVSSLAEASIQLPLCGSFVCRDTGMIFVQIKLNASGQVAGYDIHPEFICL